MSEIISLAAANQHLQYIDPGTGNSSGISEMLAPSACLNAAEKKLAFLYLDNSVSSIAAFWNFFNSNHACALLSSSMKQEFKDSLETLYQPHFIYDIKRESVDGYTMEKINSSLEIFISRISSGYSVHDELKILLSTSGTTGSPKFVKLSEKNLVSNTKSILEYLPVQSSDVTPLNLPIHYSYGLSVFITNSVKGGKIICTTKDILQREFWSDFEKYQCTSLAGVPYVYETLFRTGFTKKKFISLKYMTQAGGKLNEKLVDVFSQFAEDHNVRFFIMYGQTEATARMSFLAPEYLQQKKMSIGKAIAGGRFEVDPVLHELLYFGENVFGGYAESWKDLNSYRQELPLHTGDMATVDAAGFYFITGRIKRIVKLFGNRINLDEIEKVLNEQFHDSSFICTGLEDQVLLVGVKNFQDDEKIISHFLHSKFSIHPSVIRIKQVEHIPLTDNQKVNYTKFMEQHGD
ncbi:MAG: AMP-binding protein [Bacteroidetes bacterium]|nr:AMP-binding protein [Bacteroidota bacterium]